MDVFTSEGARACLNQEVDEIICPLLKFADNHQQIIYQSIREFIAGKLSIHAFFDSLDNLEIPEEVVYCDEVQHLIKRHIESGQVSFIELRTILMSKLKKFLAQTQTQVDGEVHAIRPYGDRTALENRENTQMMSNSHLVPEVEASTSKTGKSKENKSGFQRPKYVQLPVKFGSNALLASKVKSVYKEKIDKARNYLIALSTEPQVVSCLNVLNPLPNV